MYVFYSSGWGRGQKFEVSLMEVKSSSWKCWVLLEALEENPFLPPPAPGGQWHSLACSHVTPIFSSAVTLPILLLKSNLSLLYSYKDTRGYI